MKTSYDATVDAAYLEFSDDTIVESEEIRPGFILDLGSEGRIIGIEILDASVHMARGADLKRSVDAA